MAKIIGLTGGIGSGKSSIINYIKTLGYKTYLADDAGKKIMQRKDIVLKIVNLLGKQILAEDGSLDRKSIASIVFSDPDKLKKLNNIVHPAVAKDFEEFVQKLEPNEIVVKESALLFETKMNEHCDFIILITAPIHERVKRVVKRDGVTESDVLKRIKNQMNDEDKAVKSDFVINNIDLRGSFEEISRILKNIEISLC